jgi:hypothetical protein
MQRQGMPKLLYAFAENLTSLVAVDHMKMRVEPCGKRFDDSLNSLFINFMQMQQRRRVGIARPIWLLASAGGSKPESLYSTKAIF